MKQFEVRDARGNLYHVEGDCVQVHTYTRSSTTGNHTQPTYLEVMDKDGKTVALFRDNFWVSFHQLEEVPPTKQQRYCIHCGAVPGCWSYCSRDGGVHEFVSPKTHAY